ncbi:MAG: hypothetical protein BGN88_10975 [Clostridiales bacterium 43-6]|nr:MAG: hypothetical protein BGN88_10975 [Clostridiales bacterium 43-6]
MKNNLKKQKSTWTDSPIKTVIVFIFFYCLSVGAGIVATLILGLVVFACWDDFLNFAWATAFYRAFFNIASTMVLVLLYKYIQKKQNLYNSHGAGIWATNTFSFIAFVTFISVYMVHHPNTPLLLIGNTTLELSRIMINVIPIAAIYPIFQKRYGVHIGTIVTIILSIIFFNLIHVFKIYLESNAYEQATEALNQFESYFYNIYLSIVIITLLFLFRGNLISVALVNGTATMLLDILYLNILLEKMQSDSGISQEHVYKVISYTGYFLISCVCVAYLIIVQRKRQYDGFLPERGSGGD